MDMWMDGLVSLKRKLDQKGRLVYTIVRYYIIEAPLLSSVKFL